MTGSRSAYAAVFLDEVEEGSAEKKDHLARLGEPTREDFMHYPGHAAVFVSEVLPNDSIPFIHSSPRGILRVTRGSCGVLIDDHVYVALSLLLLVGGGEHGQQARLLDNI
jgi:hypothetical protein